MQRLLDLLEQYGSGNTQGGLTNATPGGSTASLALKVLRLKNWLPADCNPLTLGKVLAALEKCTVVEALYIQNLEDAMTDQVRVLSLCCCCSCGSCFSCCSCSCCSCLCC